MSLIDIDVGCSSVKTAAYDEEENLLVVVSNPWTGLYPEPGFWEQDADASYPFTRKDLRLTVTWCLISLVRFMRAGVEPGGWKKGKLYFDSR